MIRLKYLTVALVILAGSYVSTLLFKDNQDSKNPNFHLKNTREAASVSSINKSNSKTKPVDPKRAPASVLKSKLTDFLKLSDPKKEAYISMDKDKISQISRIKISTKTVSVDDFVAFYKSEFGLKSGALELSAGTESKFSIRHQYNHFIEGYQVFGSFLSVITDKENTNIVLVNNNINPIGTYDLSINFNSEMALPKIQELDPEAKIALSNTEPIFFKNENEKTAELSWQVSTRSGPPLKIQEYFVSAKTGKVLYIRDSFFK